MQSTQQLLAAGIRYRLAIIGKSQRWLADSIGMSTYALSRRMHGTTPFDVEVADRIAHSLHTNFEGLIALPADSLKAIA